MPETPVPEQDPVVSQSLSGPLLIAAFLLVMTVAWSLYDELYGQRPWKDYQQRFVLQYTAYLKSLQPKQASAEEKLRGSDEYKRLEQALDEAQKAVAPRLRDLDREVNKLLTPRIMAVTKVFQEARGKLGEKTYQLETASSTGEKESRRKALEQARQEKWPARLPAGDGKIERVSLTYDELEREFNELKDRRAKLQAERAELLRRPSELRAQRDAYLKENLVGLNEEGIAGLLRNMETFKYEIKQIHVGADRIYAGVGRVDMVDRCQSCHVGILEPVTLTKEAMGGEAAFTSHPNSELLRIHDPERFGCSPCHGGNGRATTSVKKAHGQYKHWLWPLYARENVEVGCQQCHSTEMVLEHAEVLNAGKQLFRNKGCIGCHRYEGFDTEAERLRAVQLAARSKQKQRKEQEREVTLTIRAANAATDNAAFARLNAKADGLRQGLSLMDHELEQIQLESRSLMRELKKVGPNLKEVRQKLRPEWLPVWIQNPHEFRPTTKMPRFRLEEQEVQAIAAYLWQSGTQLPVPKQPPGDPVRGKESFETRGCMGCHSVGEGNQQLGGTFAANLSRLGEKANYEYIVRWIHNPRERSLPYCPLEKRDIGPEDYAQHGLPFRFDLDHSLCPNDGAEMQVQQMTVMPNLRLSWQESRDIASYLMTLKREGKSAYPAVEFLNDPKLKSQGAFHIRHYGCAGCHEISGFEEESRIGTELTTEGSKPIERLDFALLTHDAKKEGWYDHKGFFEHKLADPAVFDQGKVKPRLELLRMPELNVGPQEITALTTFLLGSVDQTLPAQYQFRPSDQRKDIQEGWWIATKYNCMGCHQVRIGQESVLMNVPRYQTPDGKEQLPPRLVGVGARVNPAWLLRFLENPALSSKDTDRNGARHYLKARMPTFHFSDGELRKLVRFFAALATQATPYIPPRLEPLSSQEMQLARQLFTHPAAPCLKCHATGDPAHDRNATAPNFLLAKERLKPGWTKRWMVEPSLISPGTSMPDELFRQDGERWVFNFGGPAPESFRSYEKDHVELLTRYMFQMTPQEQRRLTGRRVSASVPVKGRKLARMRRAQ